MNFKQLNEAFECKYTPEEMLNEAKKPEIISYSDYKQKHNDIAGLNKKNAPVEISEDNFREQLRDVGKPELIGDAEDFFDKRQSKFAIAANTDSKNKEKNKRAIDHIVNASAEDELDESVLEEGGNNVIYMQPGLSDNEIEQLVYKSIKEKAKSLNLN